MHLRYALPLLMATPAMAQYCAPDFQNGCFSWHSQSIDIGTVEWVSDGDCTASDHADLGIAVQAGVPFNMQVTSGNWTGCAVWVDLNNDQDYAESEVMYYNYVGGDPGYTYSFTITIPESTPTGSYHMRVISAWGSDGFTVGSQNGFGPCGDFQYGNHDDFLLDVENTIGLGETQALDVTIGPNPTNGILNVRSEELLQSIVVWSAEGRMVTQLRPTSPNQSLDLGALSAGAYRVRCIGANSVRTVPVLKQ